MSKDKVFKAPDTLAELGLKAAHQNESKKDSRKVIADCVKSMFKNRPISFVEFLGAGKGAEYYADNLNISWMLLVEKQKRDYDKFLLEQYRPFARKHFPMKIDFFHMDLQKYLRRVSPFYWNVVNLDFCSYCYKFDNGNPGSPLSLIEDFFEHGAVCKNNSLLITSFSITGVGIRMANLRGNKPKTVYANEDAITEAINELASRHGFTLRKVLSNTYDATSKTKMLNLGFAVE